MDITNFFTKTELEKKPKIDKKQMQYSEHLSNIMKNNNIDMNEYTFMLEFYRIKGSIIKIHKFNEIIKKIKNKDFIELCERLYKNIYDSSGITNVDKLFNKLLKSKFSIEFTNDQKNAIKKIMGLLISKEYSFGLYGYAGTGKTTLIIELTYFLLKNNIINSIVLTAPTNKAVTIMKTKFSIELGKLLKKQTGIKNNSNFKNDLDLLNECGFNIEFITIHKLLNYKNEMDVNGEKVFVKKNNNKIDNYDLIIIDECSMIPMNIICGIFDDIMKLKKMKNKFIPKIIFVGDPAQLPPVNENISVIFDSEIFNNDQYMKYHIMIKHQQSYTLKSIVRNKLDDVIGLCNSIRDWVMDSSNIPKIKNYAGKNVLVYNKNKIKEKWLNTFVNHIKKNYYSNIILTWTNKQSRTYNSFIRQKIFNKKDLKKFEKGDILILNDFYNMPIPKKKRKKKFNKFYTSEQVKVIDIKHSISDELFFTEKLNVDFKTNIKPITDKYISIMKKLNSNTKRHYNVWKLYTRRLMDNNDDDNNDLHEVIVIDDKYRNLLNKERDYCSNIIKTLRNFYYGRYKDQIENINKIIRRLWTEWDMIFNEPYANIDYGNSISSHKSQGSTFYNVFIDINDILKNNNENEAKRCIYTAVTRASNEVHLLI